MAYENTDVPVSRSQEHIRDLLVKHDAQQFNFSEGVMLDGRRFAAVEFVHEGHLVRFRATLRLPDEKWVADKVRRARTRTREQIEQEARAQEERRVWRVLFHSIKARLVAVDEGLETFAQAFLAHLVDPASDRTLWEAFEPHVDQLELGGQGLRALTAGDEREDQP